MVIVPPGRVPSQDPEAIEAHEAHVAEDVASARGRRVPGVRNARWRPPRLGPVLVLVGIAVFIVGCFLPYYHLALVSPGDDTATLFDLIVAQRHALLAEVGGLLYLFGGAAVVVGSAVAMIRCGCSWSRPALFAAVGAWTAQWVGSLTTDAIPGGRGAGLWVTALDVALVLGATLKVWGYGRAAKPGRASRDAA